MSKSRSPKWAAYFRSLPSVYLGMLALPYHLRVTCWLDTLLKRPSHTEFTVALKKELGCFLDKHQLEVVENGYMENVAQLLLNVKFVTTRSQELEMKFVYLVDTFDIKVRPALSGGRWQDLPTSFPRASAISGSFF